MAIPVILRERAPKRSFGRRLKDLLYAKRILRSPTLLPTLLRSVPGARSFRMTRHLSKLFLR